VSPRGSKEFVQPQRRRVGRGFAVDYCVADYSETLTAGEASHYLCLAEMDFMAWFHWLYGSAKLMLLFASRLYLPLLPLQ